MAKNLLRLLVSSLRDGRNFPRHFAELYSDLFDYAEHSLSVPNFELPTALGQGAAVPHMNKLITSLYGGNYACFSYGGSSGTILTLLTAVLPKLSPNRNIILFDEAAHQSAMGGIIFGRWSAVKIKRRSSEHGTVRPLTLQDIIPLVEKYGSDNISTIFLVTPTYDGFRSKSEEENIYSYAKKHGIILVLDGAWGGASFTGTETAYTDYDVLITSPHKRGLTPSSLGCMITNNERIAKAWDEALDLGFRSSSISFVETMVAEYRLTKVRSGEWDHLFDLAAQGARELSGRIGEVHPDLYCVSSEAVGAEMHDPAHILINTSKLGVDARLWAKNLAQYFALDVEKSTSDTILLLSASPIQSEQVDQTLKDMRLALDMTLTQEGQRHAA